MAIKNNAQLSYQTYMAGGGEMGRLTRNFDWQLTPLGHPQNWSQSLLTTISIVLNSRFPMFLWWGPHLIQFYNDAYRPSLGATGKHPNALGQQGQNCWPEILPVIKPLIDKVMDGGEATWSQDQLIPIYRNNKLEDVYWTFSYSPVIDETGKPGGVLVICNETTEAVLNRQASKKAEEELLLAQKETAWQRDRLTSFFMQAPAGICILHGPDMVFEMINPAYQQLFVDRDLLGKPLLTALPELQGQPIWDILQDVYQNNKPFEGKGLLVPLAKNNDGPVVDRYFNFIYQPRYNISNEVDGIMVFVFEVTDMVTARKAFEKAQDTLKLALNAAELGTFDLDLENNTLDWDERCRTLFGISHNKPVSYDDDFVPGLHPDDRDRVLKVIDRVFNKALSNGDYDIEYRTVGVEDGRLRWLRAMGKAYFNEYDKPIRFIGAVLDITEVKQDEIRKNDFIAMVSHELKTPLTSLKAYVQLVMSKAIKNNDSLTADMLGKVDQQIKKMTQMINGFLNISRLEAGKIPLEKTDFCLNDLITEVVESFTHTVQSHDIKILPCEKMMVNADYDKIGQVINNLISNAIKYSPRGKLVEISCCRKNNFAQISIRDEGMGIKPNDIGKLFDRFYRVETKHTENVSGFGIGLYLCSEIIKHHGTQIWVDSQSGTGSTFYFTIPLA